MKRKIIILLALFVVGSMGYFALLRYHRYTHPKGNYPPEPDFDLSFVNKNLPAEIGNFYLATDSINLHQGKFIVIGNITDAAYINANGKIEKLEQFEEEIREGINVYSFANKKYWLEVYHANMDSIWLQYKPTGYERQYGHLKMSN